MPFQFHLYGFFVGLGITIAILLFEKVAEKEKLDLSINHLALWIIIPGLIGARVYHLITDWELYGQASFIDLIAVWHGGLGFIGALLGGMIGLLIYLFINKKIGKFWLILDISALVIHIAQAIGRLGNFFNQELYGVATDLPWGIKIEANNLLPGMNPNSRYHPLFIYESLAMIIFGFSIWMMYQTKSLGKLGTGRYFAIYGIYYAGVRFLLEFLRVDSSRFSSLPLSIFSTAQWMMVGLFVICLWKIISLRSARKD